MKNQKITCKLNKAYFQVEDTSYENKCDFENTQREIIDQFKEKFQIATKNEKILILTALPKIWSCARIVREFGVCYNVARKVKKMVEDKGILSCPDPKPGKQLSQKTALLVKEFYYNNDIRQMPGKKDYISMGKDLKGLPIHVQK